MAECCAFLSIENNNDKYIICNCMWITQMRKSSKVIIERMGKCHCNIKTMDLCKNSKQ